MTRPDELPPPDLIDTTGRMRRLVLAFVVGCVVAAIVYFITNNLAKPDEMPNVMDGGSKRRAFGFVFYSTGLAFAGSFAVTLLIQNTLEKRKWRKEMVVPSAKLRK